MPIPNVTWENRPKGGRPTVELGMNASNQQQPSTAESTQTESTQTHEPEASRDDEIRTAIVAGDHRKAFTQCAQHFGESLGRLCMAMTGDASDAEELAQETLLTAYQAFDGYRGEGSVRAWLFGIARKKCLKHLEKRRRIHAKLRLVAPTARAENAEEMAVLRQQAERARRALELVRPTEREALLLRYAADLSFEDVALACEVDSRAARKRVSRGLSRLRDALNELEAT